MTHVAVPGYRRSKDDARPSRWAEHPRIPYATTGYGEDLRRG